jgi:hypothetical protein
MSYYKYIILIDIFYFVDNIIKGYIAFLLNCKYMFKRKGDRINESMQ